MIFLEKIKIKEAVIVEGRYDKNALSQVCEANIIETSGFNLFNNKSQQEYIRKTAETQGIIIMTDSDASGFMIRNLIKSFVPPEYIKNAYIPDVPGKERRKTKASSDGLLGVEGMPPEVLLKALLDAGAQKCREVSATDDVIQYSDLYNKGLCGGSDSRYKRSALLKKLGLPEKLSAKALLLYLNAVYTRDEFFELLGEMEEYK